MGGGIGGGGGGGSFGNTKGSGRIRGFPKRIHEGNQGKHIPGHNNYMKGRSVFRGSMKKAQELVDQYAGTGQQKGPKKEVIDFGEVIGTYIDHNTGRTGETTRGTIHYSKKGTHIVPARPKGWKD